MYIIICVMSLGLLAMFAPLHHRPNKLDKNATIPLRGILAILIVMNHIALVSDIQKITPPFGGNPISI